MKSKMVNEDVKKVQKELFRVLLKAVSLMSSSQKDKFNKTVSSFAQSEKTLVRAAGYQGLLVSLQEDRSPFSKKTNDLNQ